MDYIANIISNLFYGNQNNNNNIGILGHGEIGNSLKQVYNLSKIYPIIRDPYKGLNNSLNECSIVNVAIPYYDNKQFQQSIQELNLKDNTIVIIHSTVKLNNTNILQELLPNLIIISSPVRGVHPNLAQGLLTFEKYIGISDKYMDDENIKSSILNHFLNINMKPVICKSMEAELAKIMSTSLYGIMIAAVEDIGQICDQYNLDFDKVYTQWQTDYNKGYSKLGKHNVQRPVLTRIPNKQKVIGGHCVVSNAVILNNMEPKEFTNPMAKYILRYSNEESLVHKAKKEGDNNDSRYN